MLTKCIARFVSMLYLLFFSLWLLENPLSPSEESEDKEYNKMKDEHDFEPLSHSHLPEHHDHQTSIINIDHMYRSYTVCHLVYR